jgi:glycerol uptake facilitator-like aquaporin
MFSNSFAGIAPSSVPNFIAAQVVGGVIALVVIKALYPRLTPAEAAEVVVPHPAASGRASGTEQGRPESDRSTPSALSEESP